MDAKYSSQYVCTVHVDILFYFIHSRGLHPDRNPHQTPSAHFKCEINCVDFRFSLFFAASVFTGIFIIAASYAECDPFYVVAYFTISVAFQGVPGVAINTLDLSPNYASILMGISGTFTSITGILVPYMVGVVTPNVSGSLFFLFSVKFDLVQMISTRTLFNTCRNVNLINCFAFSNYQAFAKRMRKLAIWLQLRCNHIALNKPFQTVIKQSDFCFKSICTIFHLLPTKYLSTQIKISASHFFKSFLSEWRMVFWITFWLQILKLLIFSIFGSGDVQPWDTYDIDPEVRFILPGDESDDYFDNDNMSNSSISSSALNTSDSDIALAY